MSQAPRCCPHCGADIIPLGQPGLCWHCRKPLPPIEINDRPEETAASLKRPRLLRNVPGRTVPAHWATLLFVVVFILWQSMTKGWVIAILLPTLPFVIPLLFLTRLLVRNLIARDATRLSVPVLARIQLFGVVMFYFCMPGSGDGSSLPMFGLALIDSHSSIVALSEILCMAGAAVALLSTIVLLVLYFTVTKTEMTVNGQNEKQSSGAYHGGNV